MGVKQSTNAPFGSTARPLDSSLTPISCDTPRQGAAAGTTEKNRYVDSADQANPRPGERDKTSGVAHFTPGSLLGEIERRGYTKTHTRPTGGNGEYGVDMETTSGRNDYRAADHSGKRDDRR